jgi:hypothetical protein
MKSEEKEQVYSKDSLPFFEIIIFIMIYLQFIFIFLF